MTAFRGITRLAALTLAILPSLCPAQSTVPDPFAQFVTSMVQQNGGKTICLPPSGSPEELKRFVVDTVRSAGVTSNITGQHVALAMWTLFPCPFPPNRDEIKPADAKDIEGAWLFPESSQKLRFGPAVKPATIVGPVPIKCDGVGYFEGGELRHVMIAGQTACPFSKASDLDIARKNPKVASWNLARNGRLVVARTDVANHIEEWEVYVVRTPFSFSEVNFEVGDLVAYMRRERGNEVNAATQFRHLKRLQ